MDLEVKYISWVLLLMGSSAEQLALLQGGPGVIVPGHCTEQRGKAGNLSRVRGLSLRVLHRDCGQI